MYCLQYALCGSDYLRVDESASCTAVASLHAVIYLVAVKAASCVASPHVVFSWHGSSAAAAAAAAEAVAGQVVTASHVCDRLAIYR